MADTATARKRLRKQSLGSNVNTWGDTKLNEVLDVIDQSIDGYLAVALTGDLTLTTSNYDANDQAKRRVHRFTGSLSAPATVTYPSVEGWYLVVNAAGAQVTVKCAGGTGVGVPNGYVALVYGDGTDLYNGGPMLVNGAFTVAGQVRGVSTGTASTDAVNLAQMSAAIAASVPAGTAGTVFNSINDTTRNYLGQKIAVTSDSGELALSTDNPAGNEATRFTFIRDEGQISLYNGVYSL